MVMAEPGNSRVERMVMSEPGNSKAELVAALPTELWQCIAAHTSLRTWARSAAPTCKALWNLQLLDVNLAGGIAGMHWAAPRMRQPRRLRALLHACEDALEFLTIPARCSRPQNLSGMVELQLFGTDGNLHCAMALEGLLRQATSLRVLRTNLSTITPVLGLRHLVVSVAGPGFQSLSQMLPLFKSLETLSLCKGCEQEDKVPFPMLHLEGLQLLRSVELDAVLPSSIRLCEGCELHINMPDTSPTAVWTPVLGNLRSIRYCNERAKLARVPTLLKAAGMCRRMSILVAAIGTAKQPVVLKGGITRVSKLFLSGDIHVCIPSGVTWSSIDFFGRPELDIRLVDGATWDELLSTVSELSFTYKLLRGTWCLGMGLAAAHLKGNRRLMMAPDCIAGYSRINSAAAEFYDISGMCASSCCACSRCLKAEQALWMSPGTWDEVSDDDEYDEDYDDDDDNEGE